MRHPFSIDIPWLVRYFTNVTETLERNNMQNGMLLNLGLHFIRSTSFENYQRLINEYIKVIHRHKTKVIWRSMTAVYRPENKTHKRFQTYQVSTLQNNIQIIKIRHLLCT